MLGKICAKCGKTEGEEKFINGICRQCFAVTRKLYRMGELELDVCAKCGKIRNGLEWMDESEELLTSLIMQKVKSDYPIKNTSLSIQRRDKKDYLISLTVEVNVEGADIKASEEYIIPVNKIQCKYCALKSGGYHEAVIQLRGEHKRVKQIENQILQIIGERTFITSEVQKKNGVDILIGHKRPALEAVEKLHMVHTTSNKLVGERDNKRLYRTSICVRV